jgi:hypothetical protein
MRPAPADVHRKALAVLRRQCVGRLRRRRAVHKHYNQFFFSHQQLSIGSELFINLT